MNSLRMLKGLIAATALLVATVHAAEVGRYQAITLSGDDKSHTGARVLIIDSMDGHVWTWSGNELMPDNGNGRRYGAAFVYQGRLRPGSKPGEIVDPQIK